MIYGIGTDLCTVARIEAKLENAAFLGRIYSKAEQELLAGHSGKAKAETAAANFAAKEALLKAAGTGLGGFPLAELQVLRRPGGAPYFALLGSAAVWAEKNGLALHLSLTHENGMAAAFVVAEQAVSAPNPADR